MTGGRRAGPRSGVAAKDLEGTVSKHALTTSRRLNRVKVAVSVVVVLAFVVLFAGSATGLIGGGDDGDDGASAPSAKVAEAGQDTGTDEPGDPAASGEATAEGSEEASATPSDEPTEVVTGVPPQDVQDAKKLKRSLAWLRRGLADETTFRVGTFNVLGSSHTAKGGNRKGWASGYTRMGWAWGLISQADLSVVGFQELEDVQYDRMRALSGWDAYPGPTLDRGSIRNSLAWDPDVWDLVEANSIGIPYFGGQIIRRPVVKLKNKASGREMWFFNTHNPASTPNHGNNARWRSVAIGLEIDLANSLGADGTPVVFTGDFNDRAEAFCPIVGGTDMEAANGGGYSGGCDTPDRMDVDWIFGSSIQWQEFTSASQGITGRVTDHPFVFAEGFIPEEPLPGTEGQPSDDPSSEPRTSRRTEPDGHRRPAARARPARRWLRSVSRRLLSALRNQRWQSASSTSVAAGRRSSPSGTRSATAAPSAAGAGPRSARRRT